MFRTLIEKEWKSVLLSPKLTLTFGLCSLLILLSIGVGLREYRAFESQQNAARQLLAAELLEKTSWLGLASRAFREPDPLQIFVTGVHNDVGRLAPISARTEPALRQSIYSEDHALALFRQLDLAFVVQVVLSLFAILFTYDAVNGERENGTLKLIFASAVPRPRYVLAKFLGTWLGLALPLVLPALLGLLAVVLLRIPLAGDDWTRLGVFALASALYFTFFVALGISVSALTRRSSTSFLVLLVSWVVLVLVIPRASLLAAVELVPVPTLAEVESQKSGFEARAWADFRKELEKSWEERSAEMSGMREAERQAFEDDHLWQWLEEDDAARTEVEQSIVEYNTRLAEEHRHRKAEQERLAFTLSRLSPSSAYQLVAMNLAGTGVDLKDRYEDAARQYQNAFQEFAGENASGHQIVSRRSRQGGESVFSSGGKQPLDLTEMPRFQAPRVTLGAAVAAVPFDLGLMGIETLLLFAVGFVGFLRYDVR